MAATTTTTAASTLYAKILSADILNELRPYNVTRPFFRMGPAGSSKLYSFLTQTKVSAGSVGSITEPDVSGALTTTAISTSNQDATAAVKGILSFITDLLIVTSVLDVMGQFSAVLARTLAEQFETDLVAALAPTGFTNTTGDQNTTMSMLRLLAAANALEVANVAGNLVAIEHPKSVGDLRADVGASTATFLAGNGPAQNVAGVLSSTLAGFVGNPFDFPLYQTSVVPTADSAASRVGAIFRPNEAAGLYELWNFRVEVQRYAGNIGNLIVCSGAYGTAIIDAARGQNIKSKA